MRKIALSSLSVVTALTCLAASAVAQERLLNQYEQPDAGDAFFAVFGPQVSGHLVPRAVATLDYGHRPFVLIDGAGNELASPAKGQLYVHTGASFALWDRLQVSVGVPAALYQKGDTVDFGNGNTLNAAAGSDLGEMNIGLRGRMMGGYWDAFQVGVGARLYLPTATGPWTGEGYTHAEPRLMVGGRTGRFIYAANLGAKIRAHGDPASLSYGLAVASSFLDGALQVGPEVHGELPLATVDLVPGNVMAITGANHELLVGMQYRFLESFVAGVAAGPGLSSSIGTPVFRGLLRLGYDPRTPEVLPDADGDSFSDATDACPDLPGVASENAKQHGCPPDTDGDGIADDRDACVKTPGVANEDDKKHGCPADTDGDGIVDATDACPKMPGASNDDPNKHGCPTDTDGDGIVDAVDACPTVPGSANEEADKNGCPGAVLTTDKIEFDGKISFAFDSAKLEEAAANPILERVRDILKANPNITKLEIQGHTDNRGQLGHNWKLSAARAAAVQAWLTANGIAADRLTAKGYGATKPIAPGHTEAARAKNRRVEFIVLQREDSNPTK
ncbi:MAG: OmpA family protein [Polyangiaceae bacterium]